MSVPYDRAMDLLSNSQNGHVSASQRIPAIARPFVSERAAKTLDIVRCPTSYVTWNANVCIGREVCRGRMHPRRRCLRAPDRPDGPRALFVTSIHNRGLEEAGTRTRTVEHVPAQGTLQGGCWFQ